MVQAASNTPNRLKIPSQARGINAKKSKLTKNNATIKQSGSPSLDNTLIIHLCYFYASPDPKNWIIQAFIAVDDNILNVINLLAFKNGLQWQPMLQLVTLVS
jgi:hypothetical protein